MLELAYPWLLLLILLPLLWWRRRRHQADQVAAPEIPVGHWLSDLPGVSRTGNRRSIWHSLMLLAAWALLVVALARPQYIGEAVELPVTGRDLLLAVDISPSMEEEDMVLGQRQVNRLIAVKNVLNSFITQREGDRLGLLLFGTQPYIQAPLSFDHDTIRTPLQEAQIGMAGRATAIGEVSPDKAADIAASAGVRVYTIGMGAESMIQRGFLGSRRVNPSRDLDEALLKRIADKTGGQYFRARSTPELELIYENINQLEPIELEGKHYRPTKALYYWPAGIALALLALGYAITFVSDRKAGGTHE